jgi:hypothetical protein
VVEVLGMVHGLGYRNRNRCLHRVRIGDGCGCDAMSVSKEKFVRDMLKAQEARKCAEREADALAIINLENVYESYMHNKRYGKGKKCTKFQYQC